MIKTSLSSLSKIGLRYYRQHLWQTLLMILGIALGVAVVIGIDLANESASRAFDLSTQAVTGKTTHIITAGSAGMPQEIYADLRRAGVQVPLSPIISEYVTSPALEGLTFQLLGIDPFTESPFRSYLSTSQEIPIAQLTTFFTQPGSVLISGSVAERYNLQIGQSFEIIFSGNTYDLTVAGILQPEDNLTRRALEGMLIVDISVAQEITGRLGFIDRIDVILPDDEASIASFESALPENVQLQSVSVRNGTVEQMTAAFRVNLTALSLLALVVALFLIYNTMTFTVVQRRPIYGILRSIGVTRKEVFITVVTEALIIGVIGSVLGVFLGVLMGRATVDIVSQTINDLFFVSTVRDIPLPLPSLIKGGILGVVAAVVTAAFPAWEAASIPPRAALSRANLESKAKVIIRWLGFFGIVVIGMGVGILAIPTTNLVISFLGTFAIMIGFAMLTPVFTTWMMKLFSLVTSRIWGLIGRMAPREVVNAISRTSVAVAALMVAISVTIGVSLMVGSFRFTVETWMSQILHGDVYVSVPGSTVSQPLNQLNPDILPILENAPGVIRVDLLQNALIDSPAGPINISANNNPNDGLEQLYLSTSVPPDQIWPAVQQGAVIISEPLANRLDISSPGDTLPLYTPSGLVQLPIMGIYYDYTSTQGNAIIDLNFYRDMWGDTNIAAAALILEPSQDADLLVQSLEKQLAPIQSLLVRSNQNLRNDTLEIFDRTFAITGALQLMTTTVAFVGILSAMMSLQLDKQRQLGILKAIGFNSRQLWRLVTLETGLMGAFAGLLAMPAGYILAIILIYIINRRSFGWTLQLSLTPTPFIQAFSIAVIAAILAGLYPAWRIIRRNTAESIRFD